MAIESPAPENDTASALSRRGLIRNAAGAGAAGLAAGVLLNAAPASAATPGRAEPDAAPGAAAAAGQRAAVTEPLIVRLPAAGSDALDIFHGEEHRQVHDAGLAAALRKAAG